MMKVVCVMAQTLDGKIARSANHFPDWTEKADKKKFREKTKEVGVMIFGRTTFETLPSVLPGRVSVIMSRKAGVWQKKQENLIFTSLHPKKILKKLELLGFKTVALAGGAITNSIFAKEKLIDELFITISPVLFGKGVGVFEKEIEMNLDLISNEKIGENTILLHYKVIK